MPILTAKLSVVGKITCFSSLSEVSTGPVALVIYVIRVFLISGHLSTMGRQLCTMNSSVQWPLLLYTVVYYGHTFNIGSSVLCAVLQYLQSCTIGSSLLYAVLYYEHFCTMFISVLCSVLNW